MTGHDLRSDSRPVEPARRYDDPMIRALAAVTLVLAALPQSLAPYVPTPDDVVDRMLVLARTTSKDVVYDLGCGDGRIPIAAAKKYGARGVGIDIDPKRIEESKANAKAAGVEQLVEFRLQDALEANVSDATVVTLFMLASGNAKLRPVLTRQLKPGARIVSHAFSMGPSWSPDKIDQFVSARGDEITLYLWKADGTFRP
jgi:cyclopropane fatty-acyl-phospholipid synthase-like methyltransferase